MASRLHLRRKAHEDWPYKANEGYWGHQDGDSDPRLPPNKRPRTTGTRQSRGLRLFPKAMEGRREAGAGGRMANPGLCCMSGWLSVQAETPDLGLVAPPSPVPSNLQLFMQSVFWHLQLTHPALPTSLSGMSKWEGPTEPPVKEIETAQAPPFAAHDPGLSPSTPLSSSSSPASPDCPLRDQK